MQLVAMKSATMPSAFSSATSPSSFVPSRPRNAALAVQRCGAGELNVFFERGPYRNGAQRRAVPKKQIAWRCAATTEGKQVGGKSQMLVYVPPHPLIKHWVSVLRSDFSPPPMFRSAMAELGRLLIYEASRDWLLTVSGEVNTPCGVAEVEFIDPREPVKVVPILRAGLVLVEQAGSVLPANQTYHLGFVRNEETLEPLMYLNKLPERFEEGARVLVADPMLATGGTIVAALEEITNRGADVSLIRVVAAVAAPPALKLLSDKFPGLKVYVGIIDEELNEKGYIVPGLGDAGDRSFGTS